MKSISLGGEWTLRGRNQATLEGELQLTASVPGLAQLELSKAGYVPDDLFMGENIKSLEAYEKYEWWYERSFEAPKERKNVFLVFEGVDCIAEYFLNGDKIGESKNSFISHEFEVGSYLKDGENTLTVHIKSPIIESYSKDYTAKVLFSRDNHELRHIRKPAHSYGWDIMPRAVTSGIWREVRLDVRDALYFEQAYVVANRRWSKFLYTLKGDYELLRDAEIEISASCGDSSFTKRAAVRMPFGNLAFSVPNRKLWYPYGYGEANVYDGTVKIFLRGEVVHEKKISFGIRDAELKRRDIKNGDDGEFRFLINGVDVMCRGSNWVPLDAFHSRDKERYAEALELARDIGCNILRCWGGNVYEDHEFFDFCDRNGIMVWQDFSLACSTYPEDEDFKRDIEIEAEAVIRKLRMHPSIILWSGDNEIDVLNQHCDPNMNSLTRSVIKKCVDVNDIGRPYLPSSPYISESADKNALVEDHLWGPRDYFKSDYYRCSKACFVSETGYHGCPSLDSIKKFITPERIWPYHNNPEWILHSSDQYGNDARVMLMEKQVRQLFGEVPSDPEKYITASQISQAEAKKYFIERMRVGRPKKSGVIWWNLLDGWPQMSDAVVGYYFDKKLAYHYIKRSQAAFSIVADEIRSWNLPIYACNDTLFEKRGHLTVRDADTGEVIHERDFTAKANASTLISMLPTYYSEQKVLIFEWEISGERGFNHYLCGFPPFSLEKYLAAVKKYNLAQS